MIIAHLYFQVYGLPLSFNGTLTDSVCKVQELKVFVPMLLRLAFHLSDEVFALNVGNSIAKTHVYKQSSTSPFSFQSSLLHFESG